MAGRPPTPLALAKLKGSTKKNPARYKEAVAAEKAAEEEAKKGISVAVVDEIGPPPEYMGEMAKKIWKELVDSVPPKILKRSDRMLMEVACNMMCDYRISPQNFPVSKYPHLFRCLASMGLTPVDRRKLGLPADTKPANPFAAFMTPTTGGGKPNA